MIPFIHKKLERIFKNSFIQKFSIDPVNFFLEKQEGKSDLVSLQFHRHEDIQILYLFANIWLHQNRAV